MWQPGRLCAASPERLRMCVLVLVRMSREVFLQSILIFPSFDPVSLEAASTKDFIGGTSLLHATRFADYVQDMSVLQPWMLSRRLLARRELETAASVVELMVNGPRLFPRMVTGSERCSPVIAPLAFEPSVAVFDLRSQELASGNRGQVT